MLLSKHPEINENKRRLQIALNQPLTFNLPTLFKEEELMAFMGGSPFAMARDIVAGYITLNSTSMKRLTPPELSQLRFELEKVQTSIRCEQLAQDDQEALQFKNRKLSRITSALRMIEFGQKKRY